MKSLKTTKATLISGKVEKWGSLSFSIMDTSPQSTMCPLFCSSLLGLIFLMSVCFQMSTPLILLNLKTFSGDKDRPAFFCVTLHIYIPNFIINAIEWMNSILLAYNTVMCMPTLKSSPRQSCLLMSHVVCIYPMCSYAKETFILRSPNVCCDRHILQLFKFILSSVSILAYSR